MHYPDMTNKSSMRVTGDGLFWGDPTKKKVFYDAPWRVLRRIEVGEYTAQKGKQHSAFGLGPLGVAFVAANALHNAHARGVVRYRHVRVTDGADKTSDFLTPASSGEVAAVLGPLARALMLQYPPTPEVNAAEVTPHPELSVADELMKLVGLRDAGVLTDAEFDAQKARLLAGS
jgi:hypothetical protein